MTYRRELAIGAVGYIAGVMVLRLLPPGFMPTVFDGQAVLIALAFMAGFGGLTFSLVRRRPAGERLAAAACVALPILLGDALETTRYPLVYPNFDPGSGTVFASLLLFTNLGIVAAGWLAERGKGRAMPEVR